MPTAASVIPQAGGSPEQRGARLPYLPALDGLRALAIVAVLLYHADLPWVPGGFLGVEAFFVISGYLITALLLNEWQVRGQIDLPRFWLRRARRLLPALYLLLIAVLAYAVLFLPHEVAGLRTDAAAAFTYITNWYLVFSHKPYFETVGRPSLLRHLWSLAVEEQFYLLWPPVFAMLLRFWRRRRIMIATALAAALATVLMAALYRPEADPSRIYYGTDTRAGGLLLGAALALAWMPWTAPANAGRKRSWLADAIGLAALAALFVIFARISEYESFLYQGGFAVTALATATLITTAVSPQARWLPKLLSWPPFVWLGQRSYSVYLWHWPVFALTRPQLDVPLSGWPLLALRLAISALLAEASYRWVETPIRQGALGRAWHAFRHNDGQPRTWLRRLTWTVAAAIALYCSVLLGVSVTTAQQPAPPPYLAVQAVHVISTAPAQTPTAEPSPVSPAAEQPSPTAIPPTPEPASPTPTPTPLATPTLAPPGSTATPLPAAVATAIESGLMPGYKNGPGEPTPEPIPPVTAIGDSIMLGAVKELGVSIGAVEIDAAVSRQLVQVASIVHTRHAAGTLGAVVIVHVGNNGTLTAGQLNEMLDELADRRRVVLINLRVPRRWEGPNNALLADAAKQHPNTVLVDWYTASAGHPELFWDDGMHLRPEGARVYANLVAAALSDGA